MANAKRDGNFVPTLIGVSSVDGFSPIDVWVNPSTHALLVESDAVALELEVNGTPNVDQTLLNLVEGTNMTITDNGDGSVTFDVSGGGTIGGTIAANQVAYGSAADTIQGSANLTFDGTNLVVAGDTSVGDDLLLTSSGSVINWNSGDVTLTHSANQLTLAGGNIRIDNSLFLLFKATTDNNPGIIYADSSNNFNINTESLAYPIYIDASVINIANNASSGTVNFGASGERAIISTTGTVFNESGSATIDLRVEGDTLANLIFVDASQDSMGVNSTDPDTQFGTDILFGINGNLDTTALQSAVVNTTGSSSDAGLRIGITGDSYAIGIDNSDSDMFKISYGNSATNAVLGTNDRLQLSTSALNLWAPFLIGTGLSTATSNFEVLAGNQAQEGAGTSSLTLLSTSLNVRIQENGPSTTLTTNRAYAAHLIGASSGTTEAGSGTHPLVSQLAIKAMNLSNGSATTTNGATLYIESAATGTATITNNYALWVDAGTSRLDGGMLIGGTALLDENASVGLDPALSADGTWTGITITATSGYSQAFGDLVYLDPTDSRWEAADANAAAGADGDARGLLGMVVVAGTDGNSCTILLNGVIRADANFPSFTINNPIYVSESAGDVTQTQPTTTDVVIRVVGAALTADSMYFNPSYDYITHV